MGARFIIIYILAMFLFNNDCAAGQARNYRNCLVLTQVQIPDQSHLQSVFRIIENGIRNRSPELIASCMAPILRVNLYMNENVMSGEQAQAVLTLFFLTRRVTSFFFSTINTTSTVPYGIGQMIYVEKGKVCYAQVYVALTYEESKWQIMQLSIYE